MIGTANVITKGAIEQVKETAPEALRDVSERVRDSEVVHRIEKKAKALKRAQKKAGRRRPPALLLLGVLGVLILAVLVWRRRSTRTEEIAPDAFGDAVEREQAASDFGHRPVATPGA